jgi:hypothetical protein
MLAWSQSDDKQLCLGISKRRDRFAVVAGMFALHRVEKRGETGAASTAGIENFSHCQIGTVRMCPPHRRPHNKKRATRGFNRVARYRARLEFGLTRAQPKLRHCVALETVTLPATPRAPHAASAELTKPRANQRGGKGLQVRISSAYRQATRFLQNR